MNEKDAKEVAEYIGKTLGNTGINIKLCTHRLEYYTSGIDLVRCCEIIETAFEKNLKSPAAAVSYLTSVLLVHGVGNPDIWWREPSDGPAKLSKETKNSIKEEIRDLLKKLDASTGCAAYNKAKKEAEPEASERHKRYERLENQFANEARKFENDIIDFMEFLAR